MAFINLFAITDGGSGREGKIADVDTQEIEDGSAELANIGSAIVAGVEAAIVGLKKANKQYSGYANKSDIDELDFQTVTIPRNFAGLEAEMIPTRLQEQLFRVVEVVEDEDCVTITARHVWYDNLQNYTLWKPTNDTEYTVAETCRQILNNAISPVNSRVASDCKDRVKHKETDYERKNLVECFLDPENGVCAKYGLSLIRNNWDFYCLKEVGYDRGLVIQNGKNLLGVERTESIENLVTRVAPIGKDNKGEIVWLDYQGKKYIDSQYIGDYSYPRVEIYDTGLQVGKDDVTAQNIQDKLLEAGRKRFSEDKVDIPTVSMTIEFLSLGDTEEYQQYRGLDKVYLYDILTIKDTVRGYSYTAQVIGVEHDILTGMLNSVTIGKLDNWDGTRKIATWQVPEVDGTNIRLKTIMSGSFESGAIQSGDIADSVILYAHFASATIDELTSDSLTAVYAQIHELIAGRITAEDIEAGSITSIVLASNAVTADKIEAGAVSADKIAANAVTTDKIQAGAVTAYNIAANAITSDKLTTGSVSADKLAANAVTAEKIDAGSVSAINAKLGTASIADARIAVADIGYGQIKDLNASSAYFGQAVIQEGVADKLFIPRLSVAYAQIVSATIGDLVIQATDEKFYKLDVDLDGKVTATEVTPTEEEIEAGHTTDGRTIYTETDIVAEDLNTTNIYASHALMDEITANIINVDKLFAREATISHINALDLSSNTYIASTIGNWQSGSTITQTINSLDSRIASLGYGTVFYSETEPSHSGLVQGDIWICPISDNTWQDVNSLLWDDLNESMTWETVFGAYLMYTWDGTQWRKLYDSTINASMSTQIAQNTYAITLKADQTDVDIMSGEISGFEAELEIQSQQIQAAVSTVNAKVGSFIMWADPTLTETVTVGDIWIKAQYDFGTWLETSAVTWQTLYDNYVWKDSLGFETYVWDGSKWILSSDVATEVYHGTLINQNAVEINLEAQARAKLGDDLVQTRAELDVTNSSIRAEVERATTAEGGKIDKTVQYQTADSIVTEAVRQSGVNANANFIAKTSTYQDAESIKAEAVRVSGVNAAQAFLAKTSSYQTADAIVNEAVRQAGVSAGSAYIAKTSSYQTADSIVSEAVRQSTAGISGTYIAKTNLYQSADAIVAAAESYTNSNAYMLKSGVAITASGVDVTGSKHINLDVNASNYVHISSAGIAMMGSRVSINGKDVWARDDIIVLKSTDNEQAVINSMAGKHDWVLIKPNYNARIDYTYGDTYMATGASYARTVQVAKAGGNSQYFSPGTDWYRYTISGKASLVTSQSTPGGRTLTAQLGNASNSLPVEFVSDVVTVEGGQTVSFSFTSGNIHTNVCPEDSVLYIKILANYATNLDDLVIVCECAATTSKVPCSVYYFT